MSTHSTGRSDEDNNKNINLKMNKINRACCILSTANKSTLETQMHDHIHNITCVRWRIVNSTISQILYSLHIIQFLKWNSKRIWYRWYSKINQDKWPWLIRIYFVACAIILLMELACSFAVSTSESYNQQNNSLRKLQMMTTKDIQQWKDPTCAAIKRATVFLLGSWSSPAISSSSNI